MRRGSGRLASAFQSSLYFGVGGKDRIALAAVAAVEFGLRKQRADFRLAAGRKQRQPVERAGERRALDEIGAALAEPAGQSAAADRRIGARRSRGSGGPCPSRMSKATIDSGAEFARQRLLACAASATGPSAAALSTDFVLGIGEAADLTARPVDLDLRGRRGVRRPRRASGCPCGRRPRHGAGWRSCAGASAASGMDSAKAGNGRSISTHAGCDDAGLMRIDRGRRLKNCAATMESTATPPRYASARTKVAGNSSRHECRAGCMPVGSGRSQLPLS